MSSSSSLISSLSSSDSSQASSEAPCLHRGIWLRRFQQTTYRSGTGQGFRFQVVAYGACRVTDKIFRYVRAPLNPTTGTSQLVFDGVCSTGDLAEFPEDAPLPGSDPPWCRLNYLDVVLRSQAEALEVWGILLEEVRALIDALEAQDDISDTLDAAIGNPDPATPPATPVDG